MLHTGRDTSVGGAVGVPGVAGAIEGVPGVEVGSGVGSGVGKDVGLDVGLEEGLGVGTGVEPGATGEGVTPPPVIAMVGTAVGAVNVIERKK
jgi:hypothetical protein